MRGYIWKTVFGSGNNYYCNRGGNNEGTGRFTGQGGDFVLYESSEIQCGWFGFASEESAVGHLKVTLRADD